MIEPQQIDPSCWIMKPGYGSDCLHLGQLEHHVLELIGKPQSITRKYKAQYFYNYPDLGLEVDFGKPGGGIEYLFFFREGFRANHQSPSETVHGIRPGDPREKVLELLGEPTQNADAVALNMGGTLESWFQYDIGINFQFGADDGINMITIARGIRGHETGVNL